MSNYYVAFLKFTQYYMSVMFYVNYSSIYLGSKRKNVQVKEIAYAKALDNTFALSEKYKIKQK